MNHQCTTCPMRARLDKNPRSFIARLWQWHTKFCPGWKAYVQNLPKEERLEIIAKYQLKK